MVYGVEESKQRKKRGKDRNKSTFMVICSFYVEKSISVLLSVEKIGGGKYEECGGVHVYHGALSRSYQYYTG
jgi:hypothetical protein